MSQQDTDNCTLATCPIDWAMVQYQPSVPANSLFIAIFGLLLAVQLGLGIWTRTWTYLVAMVCGLILEVIGYIGRVMLHDNPFNFDAFLMLVNLC